MYFYADMSSREIVRQLCHRQLCDPKLTFYCSTSTLQASSVILHLHRPSPNYLLHIQTDTAGIAIFLYSKHHVQFHGVPWLRFVHCPSTKCMNLKNGEL